MWLLYEHRRVNRQLEKLPVEILKRYEKWKDIIGLSGPEGVKRIQGFHDEALHGEWKGFRASRLNRQYRVIYQVSNERVLIQIVSLSAHDYRRK